MRRKILNTIITTNNNSKYSLHAFSHPDKYRPQPSTCICIVNCHSFTLVYTVLHISNHIDRIPVIDSFPHNIFFQLYIT